MSRYHIHVCGQMHMFLNILDTHTKECTDMYTKHQHMHMLTHRSHGPLLKPYSCSQTGLNQIRQAHASSQEHTMAFASSAAAFVSALWLQLLVGMAVIKAGVPGTVEVHYLMTSLTLDIV